MYMRFVQHRVMPDAVSAFERFYENRIAPALSQTAGCLFASLVQNETSPDECVSMTLWNTPEDAEQYEQSGLFENLLSEARPFLADTSEWKIQLSDDFTLEYQPVKEEPSVQAFPIVTASSSTAPQDAAPAHMYLRIVSAKIRPGQFEALNKLYTEELIPALLAVDGCRYAYLVRGMHDDSVGLSVTLWDSKEQAEAYEKGGRFQELVAVAMPMLSSLYQWKLALDATKQATVATSDDLSVKGYHVVTGESF